MTKLYIFTILVALTAVTWFQLGYGRDLTEVLNVNIRVQLDLCKELEKDVHNADYAKELKNLIEIYAKALKATSFHEKEELVKTAHTHFSKEFNQWLHIKLEEAQLNEDIHDAIDYYHHLLKSHSEFEDDIKSALSCLENALKETKLEAKKAIFDNLNKKFTPEFEKFLKAHALPNLNMELKRSVEFFAKLLNDKHPKFEKEINEMKVKTEEALKTNMSLDDKGKLLKEVTATGNKELNEYLGEKSNEYNWH